MFVLPLALNVGVVPEIALLKASSKVMLIVEGVVPSFSIGVVPVMVDCVLEGDPGIKVTVPSALFTGAVIESVLVSA